jgi:hypothetical protein
MRIAKHLFPAALAFVAVVCAATVRGYDDPLTPVVSTPAVRGYSDQAPPERSQGPVAYVVGGVGADEAEAMRQAEASYPLTLEFAAPSGGWRDEYIADAQVQIRDAQGQALLSTKVDGPLMLIRLPSGRYAVEVDWNGAVKRRTVAITPGKRQHIVFEFPTAHTAP